MENKTLFSPGKPGYGELTKFDAADDRFVPGLTPGFQARDLWRFFLVDIIIILSLTLCRHINLLPTLDHYVGFNLAGKIILAIYLIRLIDSRPDGWRSAGTGTGGRWWAWPLSCCLFAAAIPLFTHLSRRNMDMTARAYAFFGVTHEPSPQDVTLILFSDALAPWLRWILLLFAVVIGPAMEELAFRGVGLDAYGKTGGILRAVLWTSLIFGLYHFDSSRILPLAAIGAMLAAGKILSRSLWCPILIHICYNAGVLLWMQSRLSGGT